MDLELQGKHPVSKMPRERKNVKEVKKTLIAIHKVFFSNICITNIYSHAVSCKSMTVFEVMKTNAGS